MNIATLNPTEIKNTRLLLLEREHALQQAALMTLQDRPIKHGTRLIFAALGFRIRSPITMDDIADDVANDRT